MNCNVVPIAEVLIAEEVVILKPDAVREQAPNAVSVWRQQAIKVSQEDTRWYRDPAMLELDDGYRALAEKIQEPSENPQIVPPGVDFQDIDSFNAFRSKKPESSRNRARNCPRLWLPR